ncbi:uncharacterized protein B0H64DRAFT_392765 [Chaetomium fimeti]|uniref:Uncharacterized protein n=1 Tax=Chaetomium fimeti TaxID=1854472 RepID=A0AAE0HJI6_9PEZI|nr:hypothetical protein B0H64DRAFT_392765 [Chaetomium fimeti]
MHGLLGVMPRFMFSPSFSVFYSPYLTIYIYTMWMRGGGVDDDGTWASAWTWGGWYIGPGLGSGMDLWRGLLVAWPAWVGFWVWEGRGAICAYIVFSRLKPGVLRWLVGSVWFGLVWSGLVWFGVVFCRFWPRASYHIIYVGWVLLD